MAIGFGRQGMIPNMSFLKGIVVVASLTAGSAMLMWLGERITEKGIGNGISIVLTINIVSRIPSDMSLLYENFVKGQNNCKRNACSLHHCCDYSVCCGARTYPQRSREKNSGSVFQKDGWT